MSSWFSRISFARVATVFAVAFGIGLGLCGLNGYLLSSGLAHTQEEFGGGPLAGVSIILMLLSLAGLLITLVVWVLAKIIGSSSSGSGSEQP